MPKRLPPPRYCTLQFLGLAAFGAIRRKGGRSLFGHNAPMSYQQFFWIVAFLLMVVFPVGFYILMTR